MEIIHAFLPSYRITEEFLNPPQSPIINGNATFYARGIGRRRLSENDVRFSQMCQSLEVMSDIYQYGTFKEKVGVYEWEFRAANPGSHYKKVKIQRDDVLFQIEEGRVPHLVSIFFNNDALGEFRDTEMPRLEDLGYHLGSLKIDFSPNPLDFKRHDKSRIPFYPYSLIFEDRALNPGAFRTLIPDLKHS